MDIIFEINRRFLSTLAPLGKTAETLLPRVSLIAEGPEKRVRMAHLAIVGSHTVNGVAALHSKILKESLFKDFDTLFPGRLTNVTNGITPRRWLAQANPSLAELIDEAIGPEWITDLKRLQELEPLADDVDFRRRWMAVKKGNKKRLSRYILRKIGLGVDPDTLFSVQVKRIHEYKRQLLNVLHVIALYHRIKADPAAPMVPRTVIFAGKAAPAYHQAKRIIKLINSVAARTNSDPDVQGKLRVLFLPNYCVSQAEKIIPAADLSEQISTAGLEASGTGNMKMSLNGALTIGTLDGANIEIREQVGDDNFFLFGHTADEVQRIRGHYDPNGIIGNDPALAEVIGLLESGHFSQFEQGIFDPIVHGIRSPHDPWLTAADFDSYRRAQLLAAETYQDRERWLRMSILNTAHSGYFSSDRTIGEYNNDIWRMEPVPPMPCGQGV
jgi:starch phosphorylase